MSSTPGAASSGDVISISEDATRVSGRRFVAHMVDGVLYVLALVAVIFIGVFLAETAGVDAIYIILLVLALTVGHVWFLVLLHGSSGRSPGKRLVGLRVVDEQGRPPSRNAMWKRSWPVLIEYLYVIAWIGMMTSSRRQRLGDRWAKTYVVGS